MTHYAMIAQRGARQAALYRYTGTNSLTIPPRAGEQSKSPLHGEIAGNTARKMDAILSYQGQDACESMVHQAPLRTA